MSGLVSFAIITIGSEILDAQIVDTNTSRIISALEETGLTCSLSLTCDDNLDEINRCLTFAKTFARFIIVSGGLGPTEDDCTREALAHFAGTILEERAELVTHLTELLARRGRTLSQTNRRQALVPVGAQLIENPVGTALGFFLRKEETSVISLPGVPRELQAMLPAVGRLLSREAPEAPSVQKAFYHFFGVPESELGSLVEGLSIPSEVSVSYRASFPTVQLTVKTSDASLLEESKRCLEKVLPAEKIFSRKPDGRLITVVHELLLQSGNTLALAESCTGGLLSGAFSQQPGASQYLLGAVVSYANESKVRELGVTGETLNQFGSVSRECALEMVNGARERFGSDIALSITGIAGPGGGSEAKPVGTFYIGFNFRGDTHVTHYLFPAERDRVQRYIIACALDGLRRFLVS